MNGSGHAMPALLLALFAGAATGGDAIYRWVDAEGRVHFGGRPPADRPAERVRVETRAADPPPAADDGDWRARQRRMLESFARDRAYRRAREAEARRRQARIADHCRQLREERRRLDHGGPLYRERPDGRRDYLDEEARRVWRRRLDELLARHCAS